ncbi:MAG: hypothetical protein AAFO04_13230 [Cyanobacteria bacterium J06592_8]
MTVKAASELLVQVREDELKPSILKGYRYQEFQKIYGSIQQRWLVVESQARRESDLKKLAKNIDRERLECEKQLRHFKRLTFACIPDAKKAAQKLFKKFKYHQLQEIEFESPDLSA